MSVNKLIPVDKKRKPNQQNTKPGRINKLRVQNISDMLPDTMHKRLDQMDGETIYIIKLAPNPSDNFGDGYKMWFRDMPNAKDTYTAATYSQVLVPILDNVYKLSHDGKTINEDSPLKATVHLVGRAVTLS